MTNGVEPEGSWPLTRQEIALIIAFWMSLAALSAVNRLIDPRGMGLRLVSPVASIAFPFVEAAIWAALTPLIFLLSSRYRIERQNWFVTIPLLFFIGLFIAIVVDLVLDLVRIEFFPTTRRRGATFRPLRGIGRLRFLNQLIVYFAVLAAGFAREYFQRDQQRQREAERLQTESAQLQAQLASARLDALRMQINPHFLFNTLHAVSALVERDPSGVRKMIARLSDLLRYSVERRGPEEVPLRDELALLQEYLEIMEVRFQGRLQVVREIDRGVLDALVPNLILQPIAENALEHGVNRVTGEAVIEVSARRDGESLVVAISDNGPGLDETHRGGKKRGVGLANTRERLRYLYGDAASLSLTTRTEGGVVAEIRIPYHTPADLVTHGEGGEA